MSSLHRKVLPVKKKKVVKKKTAYTTVTPRWKHIKNVDHKYWDVFGFKILLSTKVSQEYYDWVDECHAFYKRRPKGSERAIAWLMAKSYTYLADAAMTRSQCDVPVIDLYKTFKIKK